VIFDATRLYTAAELAEILGLSANAILNRWQRGDLPGFRLFGVKGGPVRFRGSDLNRWLDARVGPAGGGEVGTRAPRSRRPTGVVSHVAPAPSTGGGD
jgi:predicted DNA-binding transcriptional regulator AlpA